MTTIAKSRRDRRMDVLRGMALLMIFIDHIPGNWLANVTLHNFGFSDAAEVFVMLAGLASAMAYGKMIDRDGFFVGARRVFLRCARIYVYQAGLLIFTMGMVLAWTRHFHQEPVLLKQLFDQGLGGLLGGLLLQALPGYLDILPLYIVLLAVFPLLYLFMRARPVLTLGLSAAVWLIANSDAALNLPNRMDGHGWYFNPFAWQFLFALGIVLAFRMVRHDGSLPRSPWLTAGALGFLAFAFLQCVPWADWHLPDLRLTEMATPDKSSLALPRVLDMLALTYVVFGLPAVGRVLTHPAMRPLEFCGKHSLEVFASSCVLALIGRLLFHTFGAGWPLQLAVNAVGLGLLCAEGWWLEAQAQHRKERSIMVPSPEPAEAFPGQER